MSVTAPDGFDAAGVASGLKGPDQRDLALIVNRGPRDAAAAVFTSNRAVANPIIWSRKAAADGHVSAIVLNSGGANCFTGEQGYRAVEQTAGAVATGVGIDGQAVLVCSTGLIGEQLDMDAVRVGVDRACSQLTGRGGADAAEAIRTTDTHRKESVREGDGYVLGAMAKGAGMLAPGLATMLVVITTDADIEARALDRALRHATRLTFDRLDSDGCMSTNDQVTVLASGASGVVPDTEEFTRLLTELCDELAVKLQRDAEGAHHDIAITTMGARDEQDALEVGRAVARNNLFKTAVFGNDPNWGRVLAAIGTTSAQFDPYEVDVTVNGIRVCHAGGPDRSRDEVDLTPRDCSVIIDLNVGSAEATILTNDLTHDYVHENSAYSS